MPGPGSGNVHVRTDVPLASAPSPRCCAVVLRELVKHYLFTCNQIPSLYDELIRQRELVVASAIVPKSKRSSGSPTRSVQIKLNKFLAKSEDLIEAIDSRLFEQEEVVALFMFGPSVAGPKEAYEFTFHPSTTSEIEDDSAVQDAAVQIFRKTVREILLTSAEVPEKLLCTGSTKIFLLIRLRSHCGPPPGFVPRTDFQLRLRKTLQVSVTLGKPGVDVSHAPCAHSVACSTTQDAASSTAWYQFHGNLKGVCRRPKAEHC